MLIKQGHSVIAVALFCGTALKPKKIWLFCCRIIVTMRLYLLLLLLLSYSGSFAQADTTDYLISYREEKCKRSEACYQRRTFREGRLRFVKDFYIDSGSLCMSGAYIDDNLTIPEGFFYWYYPNRRLKEKGRYVNGRKMGIWKKYSDTEVLLDSTFYTNDIPMYRSYKWYNDGSLMFKGEYDKEGTGTGTETEYYPDGTIAAYGKCVQGYLRDSVWTFYHPGKQIASLVTYSRGDEVSKQCFDKHGRVMSLCETTNKAAVIERLRKYVMTNLDYPDKAGMLKQEGLAVVHFMVDQNGRVRRVRLLLSSLGLPESCMVEAVRAVSSVSGLDPVMVYNHPVECEYTLPIDFIY